MFTVSSAQNIWANRSCHQSEYTGLTDMGQWANLPYNSGAERTHRREVAQAHDNHGHSSCQGLQPGQTATNPLCATAAQQRTTCARAQHLSPLPPQMRGRLPQRAKVVSAVAPSLLCSSATRRASWEGAKLGCGSLRRELTTFCLPGLCSCTNCISAFISPRLLSFPAACH